MPHTYLCQRDVERSLLALGVGDVARVHGAVVLRMSDWTWSVDGGPEELLLVTLDHREQYRSSTARRGASSSVPGADR